MTRGAIRRAVVVLTLAVFTVGAHTAPAQAGAGVGLVSATIAIAPGVDFTPRNTTFGMAVVALVGNFTTAVGTTVATCSGPVTTTPIAGAALGETIIGASGTIAAFTFAGGAPAGLCTITGTTAAGLYTRVGPIVVATIPANVCVNTICNAVTIVVSGVLLATTGNGLSGIFCVNPGPGPVCIPPAPVPGGAPVTTAVMSGVVAAA